MSINAYQEADRLRAQIRALEQQMARSTRQITGQEADELKNIQSRFDHAGATIGERPNEPALGMKPLEYRRQLCSQYAKHLGRVQKHPLRLRRRLHAGRGGAEGFGPGTAGRFPM